MIKFMSRVGLTGICNKMKKKTKTTRSLKIYGPKWSYNNLRSRIMYFYQRNKTILVRLAENITTAQLTQIPDHYGLFFVFEKEINMDMRSWQGPFLISLIIIIIIIIIIICVKTLNFLWTYPTILYWDIIFLQNIDMINFLIVFN